MSTPRSIKLPHWVRSRTLATARGSFAILESLPGHGVCERVPALLIPGYTGSKEDFLPILEPLAAAGRAVIALDLRGQYESPRSEDRDGYAPDELAADVLAAAAAIGEDSAGEVSAGIHLVGHSMGGLIARDAVLARPGSVRSLTLLGSGPAAIAGLRADLLRELLAALDPEGTAGEAERDALAEAIEHRWTTELEPMARAEGVDEEIVSFLRERTLRTCPVGLLVMARYLLTCLDRTDELAALSRPATAAKAHGVGRTANGDADPVLPVLVVYGEDDDAWPPMTQDRMARRLAAQRSCIPGAAHSPAVEAPDTTASALTTFWNEAERHRPSSRTAG